MASSADLAGLAGRVRGATSSPSIRDDVAVLAVRYQPGTMQE